MPYQLLPAIAGTLLEARYRRASKAVFVVHEFRTRKTTDVNLDANAEALNRLLRLFLLSNGSSADENFALEKGQVVRPILVTLRPVTSAEKVPSDIPLYVGKIRTDLLGV